ncbi:pirin family protein [Massilia aquatica]|uniref:Pirin family protein n=1 Tax=Massilia aquatica TaxID=2609000 RepID=A0ABX0M978_9BURK|nr:pirin family protein [Massilia aquatica]NHZ40159.1 pirin family protein [Massilia aquatica]
MSEKSIKRLHPAQRDDIGDLLTQRPLPGPYAEQIDPFLFLNHHGPQHYPPGNRGLPFGPHPHRGFETVTFIIDGSLMHKDSAGHESVIGAGGVQWMTAGSGIVHAEVSPPAFREQGGQLEILQLWINLPGRLKMTAPAYAGLQQSDIPTVQLDGGKADLHLIAGEWDGHTGPVQSLTGVFMSTVAMRAGAQLHVPDLRARNVFLYVVRGTVEVNGDRADAFHLAELSDEGVALTITAETDALLIFGHATPINEPVVSHGPFVMNTKEEIQVAIADFEAGRFQALR